MIGSCQRKDCMRLFIHLTLNIWDSAVKAYHAAARVLQVLGRVIGKIIFPKISHDHLKSSQFVAKDSEVISRMRHWYYSFFFFFQVQNESQHHWSCCWQANTLFGMLVWILPMKFTVVFVQLTGHWHLICRWQRLRKKSTLNVVQDFMMMSHVFRPDLDIVISLQHLVTF